MKRRRGEKEKWEDFEARVGIKRSGEGKKETRKAAPNDILVQRMSSTASGRLKKFEPLDTRDFVPFGDKTSQKVTDKSSYDIFRHLGYVNYDMTSRQ